MKPEENDSALSVSSPRLPTSLSYRVFCAIELPSHTRASVSEHVNNLRRASSQYSHGARWEQTEKLHLTLKFFGDVERSRIPDLTAALMRAAANFSPFELMIEEAGAFPPRGNPRVLWLGVTDAGGSLPQLHNRIEDECARTGFPRETRRFHPHLTVARTDRMRAGDARTLARLHSESDFPVLTFDVNEIVLLRSELASSGSHYTSLERVSL